MRNLRLSQSHPLAAWWAGLILTSLSVQTGLRVFEHSLPVSSQGETASFLAWYYGSLLVIVPIVAVYIGVSTKRKGEHLLQGLGANDIDSIGDLIDTMDAGDARLQRQCREALIRLLPLLTEEKAYLLNEYRMARLRYAVRPPASPMYTSRLAQRIRNSTLQVAFRVAIIHALSRVGDQEALTMFDDLLELKLSTSGDRRVRQAVLDGRPVLEARVQREPARTSLLRPAMIMDRESLLRSAQHKANPPEDDLPHIPE